MRHIISTSILAAALVLASGQAQAQPQALTLTSADATGAPGQTITVPIDASMLVGSGGLQIIKLVVEFDGAILEAQGATPGTAISGWPAEDVVVSLLEGRVEINGLTGTPIALAEGEMFSLDFLVKDGVIDGSTTTFDLVGGAEGDAILLQSDPADDETRVKVSSVDGVFTVEGGAICTPGDALADGESTVADAVVVLRAVTGLTSLVTPVEICNADADADGEITVGDAVVVLRSIVGLPLGRTAPVDGVVARLERREGGARLVIDGASGVHGLSFAVDGDVTVGPAGDALGVTSSRGGRTYAAFASANSLGSSAGSSVAIDLDGFDGTRVANLTVVDAQGRSIDVRFESGAPLARMAQIDNYPNPFNPSTTIEFAVPTAGRARLELFNARGERVTVLVDEQMAAGASSVVWNGTDGNGRSVASGVYYAQLTTEAGAVARQRMVLLK